MRLRPPPRSTSSSRVSASAASCGVSVRLTSATCAAALATSDTGAQTSLSSLPSRHAVFIDNESLPTGMLIPSRRHRSDAAATASKSFASSPSCPHAAIQLHDSLTFASSTSAAAIFVMASPIAMRDDAAASITASGRTFADRHGFARVALETRHRHGAVGDRNLPRSDQRVTRIHSAHRPVADRDQE